MTLQLDPDGLRMFMDEAFDVDGFDWRVVLFNTMTARFYCWHFDGGDGWQRAVGHRDLS